jgi:hypothetical protein
MKKIDFKKFIAFTWPFFGLALFVFWGWLYVKPLLPEDFISLEKISNKVAGIFKKDEAPADPDAKYDFYYSQALLKPKTSQELGLKEVFNEKKYEAKENAVLIQAASAKELEKAVKEAKGGEVIELKNGEYKINLEIGADLSIVGQGSSTVLTAKDEDKAIIYVNAKELKLENLVIRDGRIGLEAASARIALANVKFMNFSATACWAGESELIFKQSYVYGCNSAIKTVNCHGEISGSIIKDNQKSGIEIRSGNFKISGNIITNNGSYGVFTDPASEIEIAGNFIDKNQGFNVRIEGKNEIYR